MPTSLIKGEFYNALISQRQDSDELKACMEQTVQKLLENDTTINKPGMLLGKIQGGKTRAFIGIIALAFDNNYDVAIILTKGTKALARQTYERLKKDFHDFIEYGVVKLYDIMFMPENLPRYVLKQKLIMIVKKETNKLERTIRAIVQKYPDLSGRKVLIIDDEADYASIGFRTNRQQGIIELKKIASQIDVLRKKALKSDFLQVTATPYSLYLQPDELEIPKGEQIIIFKPTRPAFTVLLPIYEGYVGGDFYFKESKNENSIAYYVYEELSFDELDALREQDRRSFKLEEALTHRRIEVLRKGIVNFIVGSCIRRIQQRKAKEREQNYCFVVHTEHGKKAHSWQIEIVDKLKELLEYNASHNLSLLSGLVKEAYDDLSKSVQIISEPPTYDEVFKEVITALKDDYLMITKVNSDKQVAEQLLDDNGELERTAPLNIFIGGQILDRGVTIKNLIGFYYGRRPSSFQQDTVLQHSRMFGYRPKEDLTVTRFYTALKIYSIMEKINEFDNALRGDFEKGAQSGVIFIRKDPSDVISPCSPNKIALSSITTLTPHKRMLPFGFQTDFKTNIRKTLEELDKKITNNIPAGDKDKPFLIDISLAFSIIDLINSMLIFEPDYEWDIKSFKACMEFLSTNSGKKEVRGKIWCILRTGHRISRFKGDKFQDAPDTGTGETAYTVTKEIATDIPALILIRQEGSQEQGWMDSPFWWPVLVAPQNTRPVIFASKLIDTE